MRAWLRSRGRSPATRYHEGLSRSDISGQERPELQAQPVGRRARPDPHELALLDMDLADAAHAGPQARRVAFQARLDAKDVLAFLRQVHRHDRGDGEGKALAGHRAHRELAALARRDVRDVALVDAQHDAVGVERRELEQHLAALHRRAAQLRVIATDDDAVERRQHHGARELLFDQRELRPRLLELRAEDLGLRALVLRQRLAVLAVELLALARELDSLELQVAVVEAPDLLPRPDDVAGAHRRLLDVAVERGGDRALHRALDRELRR